MAIRETMIFLAGLSIGLVLGTRLLDKKYSERFDEAVDDRVNELHEQEVESKKKAREEADTEVEAAMTTYNDIASKYSKSNRKEETHMEKDEEEDLELDSENDYDEPIHYISQEQFEEENGYAKRSLYYYRSNHLLVDDEDNVVETDDAGHILCPDWQDRCEANVGVYYIRNNDFRTDYELVSNSGEYPA
jgi:hypothetical protein